MESWKNYLKGIYDTKPSTLSILVTGSARLETFRHSGDSLAGRYYHHRLFPVTPGEADKVGKSEPLNHYLDRGGFPEPFLADNDNEAGRWRRQYTDGLIREDILNFENITQLKAMNLLVEMLRERVASPLSYQSLSEDLAVSPHTVKHYIDILEALYIVFRIYPYNKSIARSLKKQPKLYFFDTGLVRGDPGVKLENCTALSLLRENCLKEDHDGTVRELGYLRTKEGREVDFLMLEENRPRVMIEVKASGSAVSKHLIYFHERYGIPGIQLVGDLRLEKESGPLKVLEAFRWLSNPVY
jgi:predicted AAA+ superfamily ATPase